MAAQGAPPQRGRVSEKSEIALLIDRRIFECTLEPGGVAVTLEEVR